MAKLARIFRPSRNAMQSGRATTSHWSLEFDAASAPRAEPLMGWTEMTDTDGMIRLNFDSREEAVAYAQKRGLMFEVLSDPEQRRIIKAYADNFAFDRKQPWTH
ncbi:MAG TPA: ETC complex I subunit [Caulobacteraceae bacterium]|jgi:hypothetical protein|nr:ETC complex I subunit [Caulobacteraceae bacterium]